MYSQIEKSLNSDVSELRNMEAPILNFLFLHHRVTHWIDPKRWY